MCIHIVLQARIRSTPKDSSKANRAYATCVDTIQFPPPPEPNNNASYNVVGYGQRCVEGQMVTFSTPGRRHIRALAQTPEADVCYTRCINEGYQIPFHFSAASDGSGCWCCGEVCTLILDPNVTVRGGC